MVRRFPFLHRRGTARKFSRRNSGLPTHLMACVGGRFKRHRPLPAIFKRFQSKMIGIEAGGRGNGLGEHAARLGRAQGLPVRRPGVLQGTYTLRPANRRPAKSPPRIPSLQASTILPSVRARMARRSTPAEYSAVSDAAALDAARTPRPHRRHHPRSNRSRHRRLIERAPCFAKDNLVILNLSGPRRQRHGHILPPFLASQDSRSTWSSGQRSILFLSTIPVIHPPIQSFDVNVYFTFNFWQEAP